MRNSVLAPTYILSQSLRVGTFLSQSIIGNALLGRQPNDEQKKTLPPVQTVLADLRKLFERDYANIQAGFYKAPEDLIPNPLELSFKTLRVFKDLIEVRRRFKNKTVKEFTDPEATKGLPNYFTQTFHYQSDGYLSDESAELYDHQVEMVFGGGADAMRRQALVPIHKWIQSHSAKATNEPIRILDVACGTGRFIGDLMRNFTNLHVTGLDLSPHYLKIARQKLSELRHVDFVEANGESTPFKDASFDVVTNIYLFHELPRRVRSIVATEMARVLKPGGQLIFVDSIQLADKPEYAGSLRLFPQTYHEPYYGDYVEQDLVALFKETGLQLVSQELAFFSKILVFEKS